MGIVLILGAGATKACGGPTTNEILSEADTNACAIEREDYLETLNSFLEQVFLLPPRSCRTVSSYPSLPLLMSLIDVVIDRGQPLHANYGAEKLRRVREALEYVIFAVLEHQLRGAIPQFHSEAVQLLYPGGQEPTLISLNYDIIADNMLAELAQLTHPEGRFPDYGCDIQTETYRKTGKQGKLYKLHGSLNWLYCPNCHRLDVAVSRYGWGFSKALEALYIAEGQESNDLDHRYSCHGSPCYNCGTFVRPVMITPTQKKDYRNPHVGQVWYKAEEALRSADMAVFIGYSMPADDVEVVYLLKRGLAHLPADKIIVVGAPDPNNRGVTEHEVGQRYQSIFGCGIQWHTCGLAGWLSEKRSGATQCLGAPQSR